MILITGAAGKTGKEILRVLADNGHMVKTLVYRREQVREVEKLGAQSVLVGDMRHLDTVMQALQGVHAIYHICPNIHPDEITIAQQFIDIATAIGIDHFVYHSVLHPQIEAMPHHWNKMRVEERLIESGLPYTILQPAVYMQNILGNWMDILETGKYPVPYDLVSRISMVDLEDVAQAALVVLTHTDDSSGRPIHLAATYELVGTQAFSQTEVANILSRQLGRQVFAKRVPINEWEQRARDSGMGEYQVHTLVKMFNYYDKHGFSGDAHVLNWLLNRQATSFETFVKRIVEESLYIEQ
jgi:NAD(P)H dehydrogenase (quinone)